ncbi:MAG: Brp/Blh family beta-carotene 15,15'-dioxygenase [Sediminibacterium sp.]
MQVWYQQLRLQLMLAALLVAVWVFLFTPSQDTQWIFFLIMIIATGVPHGSLDFYIEQSQFTLAKKSFSIGRFFLRYLLNMFVYAIIWFWMPSIALLIFIFLTAYHFGQIDWPFHRPGLINTLLFSLQGLFLIIYIITIQLQETAPVLDLLTNDIFPAGYWQQTGLIYSTIAVVGLAVLLILVPLYEYSKGTSPIKIAGWWLQMVFWCLFFYKMPLYIGFAFYFGCWHSLLSFDLIRQQLNLPPTTAGWWQLIQKAIPFSLAALGGIAGLLYFFSANWHLKTSMGYIFMGIAILTLPHLQVFSRLVQFVSANTSSKKIRE